ncbi:hypothetical protein SteCoe_5033 [Stentor coeruleus]|uniref:Peptidase S1 domain-containing protein n=1 Tax=Stentor coeruleus TaxID=5963 RepID=A0A1R2CTD8_9CILI|nr:hypothetical protein SteCoe_5033 [Stentor coeruleus]
MSTECIFIDSKPYIMTEVLFKDTCGNWIFTQPVDESIDPIANSIGYFMIGAEMRGTGFIIKINQNNNPYAIVLTCAHIFINSTLGLRDDPTRFIVKGESYNVKIMPKFLNWSDKRKFPKDPISGNRISIPEDWLFCEIRKDNKNYNYSLIALVLSNDSFIPQETNVKIYGFPKPIEYMNFGHCAPTSKITDLSILNNCIHGGNKLVFSEGKILATNREIMSISCPSSNGMCGSPIIINTDNGIRVVGILHGGPSGTTHKKIMLTIFETIHGININALLGLLKKINKQIKTIESAGIQICYKLHRYRTELEICIQAIQNGVEFTNFNSSEIIEQLLDHYSKVLLIEAESGRFTDYNIGLTHELLRNDINNIV